MLLLSQRPESWSKVAVLTEIFAAVAEIGGRSSVDSAEAPVSPLGSAPRLFDARRRLIVTIHLNTPATLIFAHARVGDLSLNPTESFIPSWIEASHRGGPWAEHWLICIRTNGSQALKRVGLGASIRERVQRLTRSS